MSISSQVEFFTKEVAPHHATLVAVSKTYPADIILEAYHAGHRVFGENKVQEIVPKYDALPKDIQWHLIGHLQSNKVKYIAPFISLIHSVDSIKLLQEINKEAQKNNRIIDCLLQVHIAREEHKFGFMPDEIMAFFEKEEYTHYPNVHIKGLMGMATLTDASTQIRSEFRLLKTVFEKIRSKYPKISILSMGMSGDYRIALEEGSNMIRVGSAIFGNR